MRIVTSRGIPTEGIPTGLAVGKGSIWVAAILRRSLVVLELSADDFLDLQRIVVLHEGNSLSVQRETVVLAVGEDAVWALERARGEVTRIDGPSNTPLPITDGLEAHSIAAGGGSVWLGGRTGVTRIDPETGTKLNDAPVRNVADSETTSIAVGGAAVWYAGSSQPRLYRLTLDGDVLDSEPLGVRPSALAVGDKGVVWIASSAAGSVSRLDSETESVETIELGAPPAGIVAHYDAVWTSPG
jgi:streptogramin lyase